jgi:hypothetical protein
MRVDPGRFPRLSQVQDVTWAATPMRYVFELDPPTPELIGNVRIAAFSHDRVLLIDTEEYGLSAFPGGTLELVAEIRTNG